jgi:hypothetical protein
MHDMERSLMKTCYRCGSPDTVLVIDDGDSAICGPCEDNFQAAMRAEYPFGQCGQCGAAGQPWICQQGVEHILTAHSEGGCGSWRDSGPPLEPDLIALGCCTEGCWAPPEAFLSYQAAKEAARLVVYRFIEQRPPVIAAALAGTLDSNSDYELPF